MSRAVLEDLQRKLADSCDALALLSSCTGLQWSPSRNTIGVDAVECVETVSIGDGKLHFENNGLQLLYSTLWSMMTPRILSSRHARYRYVTPSADTSTIELHPGQ